MTIFLEFFNVKTQCMSMISKERHNLGQRLSVPRLAQQLCGLEFPYNTRVTGLQKLSKTSSRWICYTHLYWQFQLVLYWNIAVGLDTIVWGADVFNMISSKYIVIKQRGGNIKESYLILLKQILHFERKTKDLISSLLGHLSQHDYSTCAKNNAWKSWKA